MNLKQKHSQMPGKGQPLHTADLSLLTPRKSALLTGNNPSNTHEQAALLKEKKSDQQLV